MTANNPQAFPCVIKNKEFPNNSELERLPGMSLRDYFANYAMQAFISNPDCLNVEDNITCMAYKIADAMLLEREKSK